MTSGNFDYYFDMPAETQQIAGVMMIIYLVYCLVVFVVGLVQYILQSVGLYTIAKRRGIRKPWLAWIPVGSSWLLGCVSDQYQYVVKGKIRNKRKALLTLSILTMTSGVIFFVCYTLIMGLLAQGSGGLEAAGVLAPVLLFLLFMLAMAGMAIALTVITYITLYDLYVSCDPSNGSLFLILSIFLNFLQPLLVFICRKKDLGMPPRKPQPAVEIPTPPAEPWENNPEA